MPSTVGDSSLDSLTSSTQAFLQDSALALSKATMDNYRFNLARFARFVAERNVAGVGEVSALHLREYLNALQQAHYSASTVHQAYRVLRTFFGWCMREGLLSADPVARVRRPKLSRPVPVHLSMADVERLVAACARTTKPDRDKAIVVLFLDTGLRRAELAGLELNDIDIPARLVTVRLGKGRKGRRVPLSSWVAHILAEWLVAHPSALGSSLFGLKGHGLMMLLRRLSAKSGVRVYCHALRHTFATHYGGDVQDLQMILGHSEVSTTAEIYSHRESAGLVRFHDERSPMAQLGKK
jgi:site-specific recombinase XerD